MHVYVLEWEEEIEGEPTLFVLNKVTWHTVTKQKHSRTIRFQIAKCIHGFGKGRL